MGDHGGAVCCRCNLRLFATDVLMRTHMSSDGPDNKGDSGAGRKPQRPRGGVDVFPLPDRMISGRSARATTHAGDHVPVDNLIVSPLGSRSESLHVGGIEVGAESADG